MGRGGARDDYEVNRERHWISSACLRGLCLALFSVCTFNAIGLLQHPDHNPTIANFTKY